MNSCNRLLLTLCLTGGLILTSDSEAKLVVKTGGKPDKGVTEAKPSNVWPKYGNVFLRNKQGTYFFDPVCSRYGSVGDSTATFKSAGKTWCFDSQKCLEQFNRDPKKYLAVMVMPARPVSVEGQRLIVSDPVNKVKLEPGPKTLFNDYMSKRYYFSSDTSSAMFARNPSLYSINSKLQKTKGKKAK